MMRYSMAIIVRPEKMNETSKKKPRNKSLKPIPSEAFTNRQIGFFQGFLVNTSAEGDALSNAIDMWDSVPRYSIHRKKQEKIRLPGGFLPIHKVDFYYRGKTYTAVIRPARIELRDKQGQLTGETIEYYPSTREELIEHALRKLAAEQYAGFFDKHDFRSGVAFTLYRLRQELAEQGHSMTYDGLAEGLEVLHYSQITIIDPQSDTSDPSLISQSYLPALAKVNKNGRAADPDAKWFVQFHGLVTNSINQINYRQFNYRRLMQCSSQLARWLISQLVLKYTQASIMNSFEMHFSTIRRDSGLLDGYSRGRDAFAAVDEAWEDLKNLGAIGTVAKIEERVGRGQLKDAIYTIYTSPQFMKEQKAANRRQSDAKIASVHQPNELAGPGDKTNKQR